MLWDALLWICGLGMIVPLLQTWWRMIFVLFYLRVEKEYCEVSAFGHLGILKVTYSNRGLRSGVSKRDKYFSRNARQLNDHCSSQFLVSCVRLKIAASPLWQIHHCALQLSRTEVLLLAQNDPQIHFQGLSQIEPSNYSPVSYPEYPSGEIIDSYSSKGSNEYTSLNFIYLTRTSMIWFW